jgi:hypothetical protein
MTGVGKVAVSRTNIFLNLSRLYFKVSVDYLLCCNEIKLSTDSEIIASAYEAERTAKAKESKDLRFHNTKLLLKHYRNFKVHVGDENLQDDFGLTFDDILFNVDDDNELVQSITRTKQRTAIILRHIELMLNYYQITCEKSSRPEDIRRWQIINCTYIDNDTADYTADDLAELYNVDRRTVFRDINDAVRILSVLFFGVDGLQR